MQQVGGTNRISFRAVYYTNDVLRLITVHPKFVKAIIVSEIHRKREKDLQKKRQFSYRIKPDLDQQMKLARSRYPGRASSVSPSSSFRAQGGQE